MNLENRLLGAVAGAAVGSAMGAPVISMPYEMIAERFPGGIQDFVAFPPEKETGALPKGLVTDGFTLAKVSLEHWTKRGFMNSGVALEALKDWAENQAYQRQVNYFLGSTTRASLERIKGTYIPTFSDDMLCDQKTITSGAAAKAWICGLFHPGNPSAAINDAIELCLPTHNNIIAISGACAIASAVSMALVGHSNIEMVVDAGISGAQTGYELASGRAKAAAGASVAERIKLAVGIGLTLGHDAGKCIQEMEGLIGNGVHANEAVPAAFGFLVASGGNVLEAIKLGVNAGNDTDVVASLSGVLAGALSGFQPSLYPLANQVSQTNGLDLNAMVKEIMEVADRRNA